MSDTPVENTKWRKTARITLHAIVATVILTIFTLVGATKFTYIHTTYLIQGAQAVQILDEDTEDVFTGDKDPKTGKKLKDSVKNIKYVKDGDHPVNDAETALNTNYLLLGKRDDSSLAGSAQALANKNRDNPDSGWAIVYPSGIRWAWSNLFLDNSLKWNIIHLEELPIEQKDGESYKDAAERAVAGVNWWDMSFSHFTALVIALCMWSLLIALLWVVPRWVFRKVNLL